MTTTSPFQQGAVVQVAQGVLRGVGPMGPRGYTGRQGPAGPQGIPGVQPQFEPIAAMHSITSTITITNNGSWQRVALTSTGYNAGDWTELVTADGTVRVVPQSTDGVSYLMTPTVVCRPGSAGTEDFVIEVGLFAGASPTPFASSKFTHNSGAEASTFSFSAQQMSGTTTAIGVGVRVLNAAVSPETTYVALALTSTGGPRGSTGAQGVEGPEGPEGPQGPAGNASSGYTTLDGIDSAGDADADPGTSMVLNNQSLPYPAGTQAPKFGWFFKEVADAVAKRAVRRFASSTDETNATDREVGQVFFQNTTNSLHVLTADDQGDPVVSNLAQVVWSVNDPPDGVVYPANTVWLKVV